jgi:hypothetical protein
MIKNEPNRKSNIVTFNIRSDEVSNESKPGSISKQTEISSKLKKVKEIKVRDILDVRSKKSKFKRHLRHYFYIYNINFKY